jgi:hypothetical protein
VAEHLQLFRRSFLIVVAVVVATAAHADVETVFRGRPSVQIVQGGDESNRSVLSAEKAEQYDCVISQINGEYFWATRENRPLVRIDKGAYVTFIAPGAGYVKVVKPELKEAASLADAAAGKFDYIEHLTMGITTVSYYGRRR